MWFFFWVLLSLVQRMIKIIIKNKKMKSYLKLVKLMNEIKEKC